MGSVDRHGHSRRRTPTYISWETMRQRCLNPNSTAWPYYGGRGITICERWATFENFLADMGERPADTSLDRIYKDGNYEPRNCRWATRLEQAASQRFHGLTSHCAHGHKFTPENTYWHQDIRHCRRCRAAADERQRAKRAKPCLNCGQPKADNPGKGQRYCLTCKRQRKERLTGQLH